jgi:hypothetical protein
LEGKASIVGILRHQLPRADDIPFTSNNSSACVIIDSLNGHTSRDFAELAASFVLEHFVEGSDPGVCVSDAESVADELVSFSLEATGHKVTQARASKAVCSAPLQGLGGTNDGIIGAAAAVGLTRYGWCGRYIEYGALRELKDPLTVGDLADAGIMAVSVDRDPAVPLPEDRLSSQGWIRPSLWSGRPVLQVVQESPGVWRTAHNKRGKRTGGPGA